MTMKELRLKREYKELKEAVDDIDLLIVLKKMKDFVLDNFSDKLIKEIMKEYETPLGELCNEYVRQYGVSQPNSLKFTIVVEVIYSRSQERVF